MFSFQYDMRVQRGQHELLHHRLDYEHYNYVVK